ncbi:hypothetical protein pb186bvf_019079 [Paramecium bursaria]
MNFLIDSSILIRFHIQLNGTYFCNEVQQGYMLISFDRDRDDKIQIDITKQSITSMNR